MVTTKQLGRKVSTIPGISKFLLLTIFILSFTSIIAQQPSNNSAKTFAEQFFVSHNLFPNSNTPLSLKEVYQSPDSITNPVYCFQNEGAGYVIVSYTNGHYYVMGYSATGMLNADLLPIPLKSLLKTYEKIDSITENPKTLLKSGAAAVEPLLDKAGISLNQYNHANVGNCPSGCVATAMTQIMCYYKYPSTGTGSNCYTHSIYGQLCADFGDATYNWTTPSDSDYMKLSYHVGVAMNMNYCADANGSSPSSPNYYSVLQKNFKYNLHYGTTESFYLKNELDNNRPIYCELPGDPGHALVVDGYDTDGYFHLNFGWGGFSNGYFILNSNSTFNVGYTFGTNVSVAIFVSPNPFKINTQDSLALVSFHNSTNAKTGWDLTKPVVNWPGVIVMNERVISLKITNFLEGAIPAEIGNLTALQNFSIRGTFTGSFPTPITNLTSLKELSIDYLGNSTKVSLPQEIGNLVNLETLSIKAQGQIPKTIGNLTKLKLLLLSGGSLTGEIPEEIYSLTNLEDLNLWNNQLTENISPKIGQLTKLKALSLQKNQLSGTLPVEIGNLTDLSDFYIAENQFSGTIPESIGNWTKLQNFSISNNAFEGMLPNAMGKFQQFTSIDISNNKFTALPDSIGGMSSLQQIVANNNLIDSIPTSVSKLTKLYRIDLSNNNLTTLPDLGTMPALWDVNLSNNQITVLPESFGKLVKVSQLYLDNNKLSGLPSSFQNLTTLHDLSINNNQLAFVPISFSLLSGLEHLYLKSNQISGPLPPLSHLGLLDFNIRMNKLTFSDIAASKMPDDSIYTDSYEFNYYDQARIEVTDSLYMLSDGDSMDIDIRTITRLSHPNNVYTWYKNNQEIQKGAVLNLPHFTKDQQGMYTCKVNNPKYKKLLVLETDSISILSLADSLSNDGFVTTSKSNNAQQFTDHLLTLTTPTDIRGTINWQASVDSIHWYSVTDTMSQTSIKQNIQSISNSKIVLEPKSPVLFRYVVKEGTCNPVYSDTISVVPYGKLLLDTIINVKNNNVIIAKDSIEIVFPANFTDKEFRLTIEKLNNPPACPDSMKLSSVYDINISCGSVFNIPLQIKFRNVNKSQFNIKNIDRYKAVYYDDKIQQWVVYPNSEIIIEDSTVVFNTYHLTKLAWFELAHGSYTHIHTYGKVNVIYKSGVGAEDNFYAGYAFGIKNEDAESWHDPNTDPKTDGNPYMVQDIAGYMNQIINKFQSLGLETPGLRFNVYLGVLDKGAAGMTDAGSYLSGRGYIYIDPTYATDRADLKTTLAHEYMHYTQDYYMEMLTHNYFWAEATAPLADRLVWDATQLENAEPELLLQEACRPLKDAKNMFDVLSSSWDDYTNLPLLSKWFINSSDANLASTFLHYMRSFRSGDKLQPDVLLKETSYLESWLSYLDGYIQKYLKSNVGDEFDAFVKYILQGSNPQFTLLNKVAGEDPLKYFQNPSKLVTNRMYMFRNEKMLKDSIQLDVPYLAAKMVQMYNLNTNQKLIVRYKRNNARQDKMKVYICKYNSDSLKMLFEDISDIDSSAFIIEKPNPDKSRRDNIAYLLFVNTDKSESFSENYELKLYNVPEFEMFDYFGFTQGYGQTELKIHSISDGTNETLDEIYMMPGVFRDATYYPPVTYSYQLNEETVEVRATSTKLDQTTIYNFVTGEMTVYEKEDWGGSAPTATKDVREMTMVLNNVWFTPLPPNQWGIKYTFQTNNTAETQQVVKSITYTRKHTLWNDQLIPPGYNPTITYTYLRTNYATNDIKFHLQLYGR